MPKFILFVAAAFVFVGCQSNLQGNVLGAGESASDLAYLQIRGGDGVYVVTYDPSTLSVVDESNPDSPLVLTTGGELRASTVPLAQAPFQTTLSELEILNGKEVYRSSSEDGDGCRTEVASLQNGNEALVLKLLLCKGDSVAAGIRTLEAFVGNVSASYTPDSEYSL